MDALKGREGRPREKRVERSLPFFGRQRVFWAHESEVGKFQYMLWNVWFTFLLCCLLHLGGIVQFSFYLIYSSEKCVCVLSRACVCWVHGLKNAHGYAYCIYTFLLSQITQETNLLFAYTRVHFDLILLHTCRGRERGRKSATEMKRRKTLLLLEWKCVYKEKEEEEQKKFIPKYKRNRRK